MILEKVRDKNDEILQRDVNEAMKSLGIDEKYSSMICHVVSWYTKDNKRRQYMTELVREMVFVEDMGTFEELQDYSKAFFKLIKLYDHGLMYDVAIDLTDSFEKKLNEVLKERQENE